MLTRKQIWRRTKTRKRFWGALPPEVLEDMLANSRGIPKAVVWDHNFAEKQIRVEQAAETARRAAKEEEEGRRSAGKVVTVAAGPNAGMGAEPVPSIPRSVSDSSLSSRRTLFPRSSSKHDLGPEASGAVDAVRRPHWKSVRFNTQVKMVLIPKREEYSDAERARLWWGREDYARFRQILIDWKRANIHRISHTDNILSINFEHIDDEDIRQHEEAVAAADAVAAAAAAAADAIATAAIAAPATAPSLSKVPPEAQQATPDVTTPVVAAAAAAAATAAEVAIAEKQDRVERDGALESKNEAAKGEAGTNGGYMQPPIRGHGDISDDENFAAQNGIGQGPHRRSNTCKVDRGGFILARSLRRAHTFVRNTPSPYGHLKAVPLSDLQATTQSLREWRKTLTQRRPVASVPNASGMDSRDRAVSLQQQHKRRGRATPSLMWKVGENVEDAQDRSNLDDRGDGKEDPEETKAEKHQRALSEPVEPMLSNPVMVAFQRQQREAAALQAGLDEKEQARAAATVEAAVAEAAAKRAAEKEIGNEETYMEQADMIDGEETTEAQICEGASMFGLIEREAPAEGKESVVQMGLNDAPGSTAAAAVVGIRMAKDGVSPLSLRARDSIENLQNFAEEPSASTPVSLSA